MFFIFTDASFLLLSRSDDETAATLLGAAPLRPWTRFPELVANGGVEEDAAAETLFDDDAVNAEQAC